MNSAVQFTIEDFVAQLRTFIVFEIPESMSPSDLLVDDLGVDSLQMFELMVVVDGMAGCVIPPSQLPNLERLADAYEYYWQSRGS